MILHIIGTGSKGNCYLLRPKKGKSLIIDCGINFKKVKIAINFDVNSICGALQTHSHGDHSKYTKDFVKAGIDVYMSAENKKEIEINSHRIKQLNDSEQFKVGDFTILPFDLKHDVRCFGFLIEHPESGRFCYITDTYYSPYTFKNLNNIIIEANYSEKILEAKDQSGDLHAIIRNRVLTSHLSLETCKKLLLANDLSKVNNIVLIHLSDGNSDEKQFIEEIQYATNKNVFVATPNMEINFDKTPF